jgi:hypothetical protein
MSFRSRPLLYRTLIHSRRLARCSVALLLACSARADNSNTNRQVVPLGETEAFMGNAGVGHASDTGAVYYNPAGLADMASGRVSVSSSVYTNISYHYDGLFYLDNTNVGYQASGFNTIPSFYAASYKLGEWTGAISILVPSSIQLENRAPFATPNTQSNIIQTVRDSDLWVGLSLAHKIDSQWSLGATLFGIQHQEANSVGLDLQFPVAPTSSGITSMNQISLNVVGLSAVIGTTYVPTDWLHLGLRFQTALIQLYGQANTFAVQHKTSGGVISTTGESLFGTPANYRLPFDFTLGTALIPCDWFLFLADVSLQLGANYSSIPASSIGDQVNLTPTPRINLGMELKPTQWLPLRFGFYYNPSANGEDSSIEGYDAENFFGVTAGIGIKTSRVETGLGGFYIWSNGQTTPFGNPGGTATSSVRGVGGLLTTSYLL